MYKRHVKGLIEGSKGVLGVLIACATAGVIIGVVTKTGVGLKLATALLDLAGGHLLPAMFFTMITSLILGMGVPTTANYVITSTIAAPALVQMDVPVLAAHMFAFYFGTVSYTHLNAGQNNQCFRPQLVGKKTGGFLC